MAEKKDFRSKMLDTLMAYSRWVADNADSLAGVMSDGCTGWDLSFSWDGAHDGFPVIHVNVERVSKDVLYKFHELDVNGRSKDLGQHDRDGQSPHV